MADKAILQSDRIGLKTQSAIAAAYGAAVDPVLKRHSKTIDKIKAYEEQGKYGLARALWRSSGLYGEIVNAIAKAGQDAAKLVKEQRSVIFEVMADDDAE